MKTWRERIAEARRRGRFTKADANRASQVDDWGLNFWAAVTRGDVEAAARALEKLRRAVE